jgi:hypothetical protein
MQILDVLFRVQHLPWMSAFSAFASLGHHQKAVQAR